MSLFQVEAISIVPEHDDEWFGGVATGSIIVTDEELDAALAEIPQEGEQ